MSSVNRSIGESSRLLDRSLGELKANANNSRQVQNGRGGNQGGHFAIARYIPGRA